MNGSDDTRWRVGEAEFRGFVKAKLEGIGEDIHEIKQTLNQQQKKIECNEKELTKIKAQSGVLGTIGGMVAGFIGWLIKGRIL